VYLPSSQTDKEKTARDIAERDGIIEGLIAILSTVEPCMSFEIFRNRDTKWLARQLDHARIEYCSIALPPWPGSTPGWCVMP
jgi:hypothetical protein